MICLFDFHTLTLRSVLISMKRQCGVFNPGGSNCDCTFLQNNPPHIFKGFQCGQIYNSKYYNFIKILSWSWDHDHGQEIHYQIFYSRFNSWVICWWNPGRPPKQQVLSTPITHLSTSTPNTPSTWPPPLTYGRLNCQRNTESIDGATGHSDLIKIIVFSGYKQSTICLNNIKYKVSTK